MFKNNKGYDAGDYSLTSSKLFKHQVELVFLFKELHQLQDVASEKKEKQC